MSRILIVARRDDAHSDAVRWGLDRLGHAPQVWYWSDFPGSDTASLRCQDDIDPVPTLRLDGARHQGAFDVIWIRRCGKPAPMAGTHPDDAEIAVSESRKFLDMLLPCLGHAGTRWVNDPLADARCRSKPAQLAAATQQGFAIPPTLIGNDADAVRAFFAEHAGQIIHKSLSHLRWDNGDGSRTTGCTSLLAAAHLEHDFAVRACPAIYQRHIEKDHELRVTVIGDTVLAAAIDSQRDGPTVDWRCEGGRGETNLRRVELDPALAARCRALCRSLGLAFGCIDLVVTPEGEVVFLEINHGGQFLFKEQADPSLPMLDTFCRYLAQGETRTPALALADYFAEARARRAAAQVRAAA